MVGQITPPNPNADFTTDRLGNSNAILSPVAFRFLTNITQNLNGQPTLSVSGQDIAQFSFGAVTMSTGPLDTPETFLDGEIGDVFISTTAGLGPGNVLFVKESNPGTNTGWVAIG